MRRVATAPGICTAFLTIAVMDVLPRVIGLRRTFSLLRRIPTSASGNAATTLTQQTVHNVCTAAAFYPRRALCLEQSLALTVLLRQRGVAADLRIGVRPRPFFAHAWVEVDGAPLNESDDVHQLLTPFALEA